MVRPVERGQRASAQTLPSDHRPPVSQPPRPGTPFSVPQPDCNRLAQRDKHLPGSQPLWPGTPFSVPKPDYNPLSQQGKHLSSRDPRDFAPPGLLRLTRHKFRCPKPYEEQRFKKPDARVAERLQKVKDLIKVSANTATLDPLREKKERKKWTAPLPLKVPKGMSNPLARNTRPSALQPTNRKRVAACSEPILGKVKKTQAMSTVFEEHMDFDRMDDRVPATSTKHSPGDTSEKFEEDHAIHGPPSADSSADQRGQVSNLTNSPPKHVGEDLSGQGDLQQAPLDKESYKPSSPKGKLSDLSFFQKALSPTTSSQESLTHLTVAKARQRATSSHKDIQRGSTSPSKCPMQLASRKVSLTPDTAGQGDFQTSPLNQEAFQSPSAFKNVLKSSLIVQREINATIIPQVSLTWLTPAQEDTKLSMCTPAAQGPLAFSEGDLVSSTHTQDVVETPESTQGTLGPSAHTPSHLSPSPSSPGVLRPSESVRGALGLFTSTEEGQRHVLKSTLPQKRRLKDSPAMKKDPEDSHSRRRLKGAPSKQGVFTMSLSDRELFKYPLPAKRTLLTCHQAPESQGCAKTEPTSNAISTLAQSSLGHSLSVAEALKISTYTSEMRGFPKPVQNSLHTTLLHKGAVGQDTSTKGVLATVPSLEIAYGCDTSTKDVLGHIPSVQKVLDPIRCERGMVGPDMHTQVSVASCTSKEGNSLDSTSAQKSIGPPQTSQEAMGTYLSPQEDQPSSQTTQDAIDSYPSAQRSVGPSPCLQMSPEHLPNIPKALDSNLYSKGSLQPVLPIKLSSEPDTIRKVLSHSPAAESFLATSTSTQRGLQTSLPVHEFLRPLSYVHDALGEATSAQVALVHSLHSAATVKTSTHTQGTLRPSPPEKDALESTIFEQGALQLALSSQEGLFHTLPLGENIRPSPSTKVDLSYPVPSKNRERVDSSDGNIRIFSSNEDSFNLPPSANMGLATSTATKETGKATATPQVSPTYSVSVQNALKCSKNDQGTVENCQSAQGHAGHSIFSQEAHGPSLSTQKSLVYSSSAPGLQGISSCFSRAPEHVSHSQGDLSFCKSDFGTTGSSLFFQGSERKLTSKKSYLELVPLALAYIKTSKSSKVSKNSCASSTLAGEHLKSALESPRPSKSEKGHLETLPAVQGSLACSVTSARASQKRRETLPSAQAFPSSINYSGHLPQLSASTHTLGTQRHVLSGPGYMEPSLYFQGSKGPSLSVEVDMGTYKHAKKSSRHLTNVSGFPRPILSDQDPMRNSLPAHESLTHLPSSQGAEGRFLSSYQAPVQCTLEQGSIQTLKPAEMDQINPSSSQGAARHFKCTQDALEHLLPDLGTLKHSVIKQGTQKLFTSAQGAHETLPSSSQAVDNSPGTEGLQHCSYASRALEHVLSARELKKHSKFVPGSLGFSLSTQKLPECLAPSLGNLKPCHSAKERSRTLTLSQTLLESSPSISGTPGTLSLALGHTGLSSLANETQKHSKNAKGVLKPSSVSGIQSSMAFSRKSLENSLSGQGNSDSLTSRRPVEQLLSTPGAVKKSRSTKGRKENVSSPERPVKPLSALQELSLLNQCPHQHSKSASRSPGPYQSDSGIQRPFSYPEVAENSTHVPGALQPCPRTLKAPDLLTVKGCFKRSVLGKGGLDSSPSTQGVLPPFISSPGVVKLSKSKSRKHGQLSNVGKDIEIFPSDTGVKGISPPVPYSSLDTEALVSCQGSQGTFLSTKAGVKHSHSAPDAQKFCPSTAQDLEPLVTTQGPLDSYTPSEQNLYSLPSTQGDFPRQRTLEMSSVTEGTLEPLVTDKGEEIKSQSEKDNLGQSISVQGTVGPSSCNTRSLGSTPNAHRKAPTLPSSQGAVKYSLSPRGTMGLPKSESRTLKNLPSEQGPVKNFSSFQKASLSMQDALQQSASATWAPRSPSSTKGAKTSLLSTPGSRNPSLFVPHTQKHSQTKSGTLATVRCKQGPLEHSTSIQETVGTLPTIPGFLEHSSYVQKMLGHSSCMVESQDTLPTGQGTIGPLPSPSEPTGKSLSDQGSQESSLVVSGDLAHLLSAKICISAQATLGPSPYTQQSLQQSSSSQKIPGTSEFAQCTHKHLSSVSGSSKMSSCVSRTTGTLPHAPKHHGNSSPTQASLVLPPTLKKAVTTSLYSQTTRELNALGQISLLSAPSTQVLGQNSRYADASLGQPITAQGIEELLLSCSGTLGYKESDKQKVGIFPSAQVPQGISLSAEGPSGSLSSTQGVLGTSLSVQGSLKLSTPKKETIGTVSSVPMSLKRPTSSERPLKLSPFTQHNVHCSSRSPQTSGPVPSSQENQGAFLSSPGHGEHYSSVPDVQEHPLSTPAAVGPLPISQGHKQNFTSAMGTLPYVQRNQECSSYSTVGLGQCTDTQSTLGHLPCVQEDVESSQTVSGPIGSLISSITGDYLGLSASQQETELSSQSNQRGVRPFLSEKGTPKVIKSKQVTLGFSPSAQNTRGYFLSAQGTAGQSMSAEQTVGSLPSRPGSLGSTQNIHMLPASMPSDQTPVGVSLAVQETLGSSPSFQEAFGHFLSDQGSLKLFTSKQGTVKTESSAQKTLQPPTSCQADMKFSPSALHAVQRSTSFPIATGPFLPSQKSQESISYSPADVTHSSSVLGAQEHTLSSLGSHGFILTSQKPKNLSMEAKASLPVQSSLSSIQKNLEPSALPCVKKDVSSSHSASASLRMLSPLPPELGRHSSFMQASAETFPSGQGFLAPLQLAQGLLKLSISAQATINTSQCSEGSQQPVGLSSSEQGAQATSDSVHEAVHPSLSTQGTIGLSTSIQRSTQHSICAQRISSPSLHTQGIAAHSTSTQYTVADSPSSPVYQGYTHPAQKMAETLKSDQGSLRSFATAQGSVKPLPSAQGPLAYSSFAPGAQKTSTIPGHVVSDDLPLELSISAHLSPLISTLSLLDPLLLVEETFDVSRPMEGIVGPSPSCQGPHESLNSVQSVQQTDPFASDTSGSMNSSKGTMGISLSKQGSASSALGPLAMSLSVQVSPGSLLSVQEARSPCLSLQGNLESCTCAHDEPDITNASPRDVEISASSTMNLESSPSLQLDLRVAQPVSLSLKHPLSAQGVLGTMTSTQVPLETSLLYQEPSGPYLDKEDLGFSPSDSEDLGLSEFDQGILETLPCMQNTEEILSVTQEIIETLSPVQDSLRYLPPLPLTTEAEEPLQSTQSVFKISESVPGALWLLVPNEDALGPLATEQGILGTPTSPQETVEFSQTTQGPLEPMPSIQDTMGTSFSVKFPETSLCVHSSKMGIKAPKSDKGDTMLKSEVNRNLTSDYSIGACGFSLSHEVGLRSRPPSQGIYRQSRSIKATSKKVTCDQRNTQASHSEHECGKPFPLSIKGLRHSSSSKKGKEPKAISQEGISSSNSTEEGMPMTPSEEESLRHSIYSHGIPRHTTSTRRRQKNAPDTQGSLNTSPADQEVNKSLPDGGSSHRDVKLSLSPQEDIGHLVSTMESSEHTLIVQEEEKPSTSAKQEPTALVRILWGFVHPLDTYAPKGSATSFPVSQRNFRDTIFQAEDVIPALSCEGRDPSLRYEFGHPLCDPSVLGGHRYSHFVRSNLKRIPLQKGRCNSVLSPKEAIRPSQSDQCGLQLSNSHQRDIRYVPPVSGSLRMLQAERVGPSNVPSKKLGLRDAFYGTKEIRNVSFNQERIRHSSSTLGRLQLASSAQGGSRASQDTKWNF